MTTISKTELARQTRKVVARARRGHALIVESYGEEQVAVVDAVDYRILRAIAAYQGRQPKSFPTPGDKVASQPQGLSEADIEQAVAQSGGEAQARWNLVVATYLDGHISLGRAATLLGLSRFELAERFNRLDVPIHIGPASVEEARLEAETLRAWLPSKEMATA